MTTDKWQNSKMARIISQLAKKRKTLKRTQRKEDQLQLEIANLKIDLQELTKKEVNT